MKRRLHMRHRSALLWFGLLVVIAAGCTKSPDRKATSSVTVLYDADERVFGPYWSMNAWFMMFLPLVQYDESGEIGPRLAKSWEHSDDLRDWTFHLRSDVKWHDGVPTTAHDIKFTIELQALPKILFDDAWQDVDSIVVANDTTLTFHYSQPKDALNDWMVYWPKHILERLDPDQFWEWEFWIHPVGNGPYRYVRHMPRTFVELQANPDFYAGKPAIEQVNLKFGSTSGVAELMSGNVDILASVTPEEAFNLGLDSRFNTYFSIHPAVPWFSALVWNHRHPFLADPTVRRAMTMAINRRELLQVLNLPEDLRLADAPFTPGQYSRNDLPDLIPFDPDQAISLLAAAGWQDTDGDQVLDRNGEPFRLTVLTTIQSETEAVYIQGALRQIGIEMRIQPLDRPVISQRTTSGEFDAAFVPFWNHIDGHLWWYATDNMIGYANDEVGRLLQAIRATADMNERDSLYRELAPLLLEDVPITLLVPSVDVVVARSEVRGLDSSTWADPVVHMDKLWLQP
jgi:peptide/nickel transport system substrate-binding protein